MEKRHKPKDQIYVSKKVLGQLYDLVERVDFIPELEKTFDERILGAYNLDPQILHEAAEIKVVYDAAMHRIMAQHEIRTEHEVWSTFVLQHANQSKDFKFHEEMGAISASLKERFRAACYEKAGGAEFARIGPFVAAMYQITSDELIHAFDEYRQARIIGGKEVKFRQRLAMNMPLTSFPWLFPSILGKIANGNPAAGRATVDYFASNVSGQPRKTGGRHKSEEVTLDGEGDILRTTEGLVHRGELLRLFVDADQSHEAAAKVIPEVATSSSTSDDAHDKVGGAEYSSNIGVGIPEVETLAIKSFPEMEKAIDTTRRHKELVGDDLRNKEAASSSLAADSLTLITLIDFGMDDKGDKESDLAAQVHSNSIDNTRPKIRESLLDYEFGTGFKILKSISLPAMHNSRDLSQAPNTDLLSLEDIVDRPAPGPNYSPDLSLDTRTGTLLAKSHSNEEVSALMGDYERALLEDSVLKHDCDGSTTRVFVTDGDGASDPDVDYFDHSAGGLIFMGKGDLIQVPETGGMVEEAVLLDLDDKLSLLENLALLNEE